jgi:hypothetical protein
MVMIGSPVTQRQEIRPGNVYTLGKEHGPFKPCGIHVAELKSEILVLLEKDKEYKDHNELANKNAADVAKARPHKQSREKRRRQIYAQCQPLVAELTPSCDFAQRNRKVVRLGAGLLVPYDLHKVIGKKESLRLFDPVVLPGRGGLWIPVFSGRYLYTMQDPRRCLNTRPAFRLRSAPLADLRNWYASQASRPGYLSLRPN